MGLEVSQLVAGYGQLRILTGVSLRARAGEITAVIGPNGSGKSTLLKAIYGLIKPRRGSVSYLSREITGLPPHLMLAVGIGFVPQGRSVFPELTVEENLRLGAFSLGPRARDVSDRLAKVYDVFPPLKVRAGVLAGNLSGGEQRMLEFGRTLITNPSLILLDEPSLGISPKYLGTIFESVVDLNRSGVTFLIVEQKVKLILEIANWAYVLEQGRNVFDGPGSETRDDQRLVRAYLG